MHSFIKLFLLLLSVSMAWPLQARPLSIATGNPSGTYYPFGGGLASLWSKHIDGMVMKAEVTGASVTNIIQVAKGESEVAITQADVAMDAVQGSGKFPEKLTVSALHTLYPNLVHLVTADNSDIQSVQDIKGKVISIGAPGSGNASATLKILEALGISTDEFTVRNLNYVGTASALKDGHIDAGFIVGGIGLAAMVELSLTRDIRLIPFSDDDMAAIHSKYPAFTAFSVPSGTYKGMEEAVQTASLWNLLVVHDDLPEETAYQMVETTFAYQEALQDIAPVARFMTKENATSLPGIPIHPGALRYFQQQQVALQAYH